MKIAFIHRNDGTDMRVSKECNSLRAAGYDVTFVGWRAKDSRGLPDPMPLVQKRFFLPPGGAQAFKYFPGFIVHISSTLRRLRPDVVHCVNEDLASIALMLKPFLGYKVVCDIFDSVALRKGGARFPLGEIAKAVTYVAHSGSDILLVTDETRRQRLGTFSSKAHVVGNFPVDVGEDVAFRAPPDDGCIRLYVTGTLYKDRGLNVVRQLLDRCPNVRAISAGWVLDDAARAFVNHPRVEFHGVVTPRESLGLAAACHAIMALYAPNEENNILASPNKVYDALCVGRPVIINSETRVSEWVAQHNIGYIMPYGDIDRFLEIIGQLRVDLQDIATVVKRLRGLFDCGHNWCTAEQELLAAYENVN